MSHWSFMSSNPLTCTCLRPSHRVFWVVGSFGLHICTALEFIYVASTRTLLITKNKTNIQIKNSMHQVEHDIPRRLHTADSPATEIGLLHTKPKLGLCIIYIQHESFFVPTKSSGNGICNNGKGLNHPTAPWPLLHNSFWFAFYL